MAFRTAARSAALPALLLAAVWGCVAVRLATRAFVPSAPNALRGTSTYAAAALAGAAAPALANSEKEPEGFLNFGKVPLGGGFELNLDIPETGIVNIAVLIAGLLYLLGPLLSESMATREKEIQTDIEDAIAKFNEASQRLAEAEKAQSQANEVIAEINASIDKDKAEFEASLNEQMDVTLKKQEEASRATLREMEDGAAQRVETYIQTTAVQRGLEELRRMEDAKKQKFMDMAIDSL